MFILRFLKPRWNFRIYLLLKHFQFISIVKLFRVRKAKEIRGLEIGNQEIIAGLQRVWLQTWEARITNGKVPAYNKETHVGDVGSASILKSAHLWFKKKKNAYLLQQEQQSHTKTPKCLEISLTWNIWNHRRETSVPFLVQWKKQKQMKRCSILIIQFNMKRLYSSLSVHSFIVMATDRLTGLNPNMGIYCMIKPALRTNGVTFSGWFSYRKWKENPVRIEVPRVLSHPGSRGSF